MATITLTVPDAQVPRIQAALNALVPPPTPKEYLIGHLKTLVQEHEFDLARQQAAAGIVPPAPIDVT